MSFGDYAILFWSVVGILALVAVSPALSRLLVLPRAEFFTELWILGPNHMAEDYPSNITRNHNYSVFLGTRNSLGYCAYYSVEVKFRNQTQSAPDSLSGKPSTLLSLYNITDFVADEETSEMLLLFSFDYDYDETLSRVQLYNMTLNNTASDMKNYTIVWDADKSAFFGYLFFELWIYATATRDFLYHERFVSLTLNMTI